MERKVASDYPQELLDLFHEYQHGDIDRRTFLDRAGKFAVGGLTVAAIFESLRPNYAWAQQVKPDDKRIRVGYETVQSLAGNGSIKGYLARPAQGKKFPAVLVIHENRGLNPYIEDVARRLALEKFIAFAPDGLTSVGGYPGNDEQGAVAFRKVDPKKMFEDFVKYCRTDEAYASLKNVETKEKSDEMQSFLFAETFKYFYLLFAPPRALDFRGVVFNTEAHPIRRTW